MDQGMMTTKIVCPNCQNEPTPSSLRSKCRP